jgi:hypothetical protein
MPGGVERLLIIGGLFVLAGLYESSKKEDTVGREQDHGASLDGNYQYGEPGHCG